MKKLILRVLALSLTLMLLVGSGLAETIRFRDKGDAVIALQTALTKLGYYTGDIDGKFGTGTLAAVKAFQKANSLTVDGLAGTKTQTLLTTMTGVTFETKEEEDPTIPVLPGETTKPSGVFAGDYRTLKYGTAGPRVRVLQRSLLALGFNVSVDGDFGKDTYAAVKAFQTVVGLTADGMAGEKTLAKLENYFDDDGNCTSGPIAGNKPATPEVDPDAPTYGIPERTLRYGDKGLDVKYAMQRLYDLKYYNKKVDETFGAGMLSAVKNFQKRNGLTADGVIGAKTVAVLFSSSAYDADELLPLPDDEVEEGRTLVKGMSGTDVKTVQTRLKALGYYTGKLDGKFGAKTQAAVRSFQARNALTVDGKVGPRTLGRLNSSSAVPAKGAATVIVPSPGAADIAD